MAIPYNNIIRAVLVRTNQMTDAIDASALETLYTGSLSSAIGGMDLPASEIKRMILDAEKRVASVCAKQTNPLLWGGMFGRSADIANEGHIPSTDNDSDSWIGAFHTVLDSTTDEPLTEKPKQDILRMNRLVASGFLKVRPMHYCIEGDRIYHTRSGNVYVEGCGWDYTIQASAYAAGDSPLAQECEGWWIAETLAMAAGEGWYASESASYMNIAAACRDEVRQGIMPTATIPDSTVNVEPVKN